MEFIVSDIKKTWKDLLEYASKSEENRKKVINEASSFVIMLTNSEKELCEEDLEKIFGAIETSPMIQGMEPYK